MELDEALVRQQLAARGVPADSIPDEVLRQVLRDFKELDVGEDGAAPLSYPTALDDAEAVAGWTTAPPEPMVAAPAAAPMPAARAPPKKKRPPAAPTAAPAVDPYDDLLPPDEADAALAGLDLDFACRVLAAYIRVSRYFSIAYRVSYAKPARNQEMLDGKHRANAPAPRPPSALALRADATSGARGVRRPILRWVT